MKEKDFRCTILTKNSLEICILRNPFYDFDLFPRKKSSLVSLAKQEIASDLPSADWIPNPRDVFDYLDPHLWLQL